MNYITNIAATLGFEILAGSVDAMVMMGYIGDHKYYQELWYDALKNGYFLPGVAETDAAFDGVPDNKLSFKTYTFMDEFSIDALCRSVRAGRNMVSSGPILIMKVNGRLPGEVPRNILKLPISEKYWIKLYCMLILMKEGAYE